MTLPTITSTPLRRPAEDAPSTDLLGLSRQMAPQSPNVMGSFLRNEDIALGPPAPPVESLANTPINMRLSPSQMAPAGPTGQQQPGTPNFSREGFPMRLQLPSLPGMEAGQAAAPGMPGMPEELAVGLGMQPGQQRGGFWNGVATVPFTLANSESWFKERLAAALSYAFLGGAYQEPVGFQYGEEGVQYAGPKNLNLPQSVLKGYIDAYNALGVGVQDVITGVMDEAKAADAQWRMGMVWQLATTGHVPVTASGVIPMFTAAILDPLKHESGRFSMSGIISIANERGVDPVIATAELWDLPVDVVSAIFKDPEHADTAWAQEIARTGSGGRPLSFSVDPFSNLLTEGAWMAGVTAGGIAAYSTATAITGGIAGAVAPGLAASFGAGVAGQAITGAGVAARVIRGAGWLAKTALKLDTLQTGAGWTIGGAEWGIKQAAGIMNNDELVALMDNLMMEKPWSMNPGLNLIDAFRFHPKRNLDALRAAGDRTIHLGEPGTPGYVGGWNISQRRIERPRAPLEPLDVRLASITRASGPTTVRIAGKPYTLPADHPQAILIERVRNMTLDDMHESLYRHAGWQRQWLEDTFGEGNRYGLTVDDLRDFTVYGFGQRVRDLNLAPARYSGTSSRELSRSYFMERTPEILTLFETDLHPFGDPRRTSHLVDAIKGQWWQLDKLNDSKIAKIKQRLTYQYDPMVAFNDAKHWTLANRHLTKALAAGWDVGNVVPGYLRTVNRNVLHDTRAFINDRFPNESDLIPDKVVLDFRKAAGLVEKFDERLIERRDWTRQEFLQLIDDIEKAGLDSGDRRVVFTDGTYDTLPDRDPGLPTDEADWTDDTGFHYAARALGITSDQAQMIEQVARAPEPPRSMPPASLMARVEAVSLLTQKQLLGMKPEEAWNSIIDWYQKAADRARSANYGIRVPMLEFREHLAALLSEQRFDPVLGEAAAKAAERIAVEAVNIVHRVEGIDPGRLQRYRAAHLEAEDVGPAVAEHMADPARKGRMVVIDALHPSRDVVALAGQSHTVVRLQRLADYVRENPGDVQLSEADLALVLDPDIHPFLKAEALLDKDAWATAPATMRGWRDVTAMDPSFDGQGAAKTLADTILPLAPDAEIVPPIEQRLRDARAAVESYGTATEKLAGDVLAAEGWYKAINGTDSPELRDVEDRLAYSGTDHRRPISDLTIYDATPEGQVRIRAERDLARVAGRVSTLEMELGDITSEIALTPRRVGEYDWSRPVPPAIEGIETETGSISRAKAETQLRPLARRLHEDTGLAYGIATRRSTKTNKVLGYKLVEGIRREDVPPEVAPTGLAEPTIRPDGTYAVPTAAGTWDARSMGEVIVIRRHAKETPPRYRTDIDPAEWEAEVAAAEQRARPMEGGAPTPDESIEVPGQPPPEPSAEMFPVEQAAPVWGRSSVDETPLTSLDEYLTHHAALDEPQVWREGDNMVRFVHDPDAGTTRVERIYEPYISPEKSDITGDWWVRDMTGQQRSYRRKADAQRAYRDANTFYRGYVGLGGKSIKATNIGEGVPARFPMEGADRARGAEVWLDMQESNRRWATVNDDALRDAAAYWWGRDTERSVQLLDQIAFNRREAGPPAAPAIPGGMSGGTEPWRTGKPTEWFSPVPGEPKVQGRFELHPIDDLVTSDRPGYPTDELQPRDRAGRVTSDEQIAEITRDFDPEQLLRTETGAEGAPLIGRESNFVLVGNGRLIAMRDLSPEQWTAYKVALARRADEFGLSQAEVMAADRMVLVRRVPDAEMNPGRAFEYNQPTGLGSPAERAVAVGRLITPDDIASLGNVGEKVSLAAAIAAKSRVGWVQRILDLLPPQAKQEYVTAGGALSDNGVNLIAGALMSRFIPDIPLVTRLLEGGVEGLSRLQSGIERNLIRLVQADNAVGRLHDVRINETLTDAMKRIVGLADREIPTADWPSYFTSDSLFSEMAAGPGDRLALILTNLRSAKEVDAFWRGYANELQGTASVTMLAEAPTLHRLINAGVDAVNAERRPEGVMAGGLFSDQMPRFPDETGAVHGTFETPAGAAASIEVPPEHPVAQDTVRLAQTIYTDDPYDVAHRPEPGQGYIYRAASQEEIDLLTELAAMDNADIGRQSRQLVVEHEAITDPVENRRYLSELVDAFDGGTTEQSRPIVYTFLRTVTGSDRWVNGRYDPAISPMFVMRASPEGMGAIVVTSRLATGMELRTATSAATPLDVLSTGTKVKAEQPDFTEDTGLADDAGPAEGSIAAATDAGVPTVVGTGDQRARRAGRARGNLGPPGPPDDSIIILHEMNASIRERALQARAEAVAVQREAAAAEAARLRAEVDALPPEPGPGLLLPDDVLDLYERYVYDPIANAVGASPPRSLSELTDVIRSIDYEAPARPGQTLSSSELARLRQGLLTFLDDKLAEMGVPGLDDLMTPENLRARGYNVLDLDEPPPDPRAHEDALRQLTRELNTKTFVIDGEPLEGYTGVGYQFVTPSGRLDPSKPTLFYEVGLTEQLARYDRVVPGLGLELASRREIDMPHRMRGAQDVQRVTDISGKENGNRLLRLIDTAFGPRPQRDIEAQSMVRFAAELAPGADDDLRAALGRGLIRHWHEEMAEQKFGHTAFSQYRRIGLVRTDLLEKWAKDYMTRGKNKKRYGAIYDDLVARSTSETPVWDAYRKADNRIRAHFAGQDGGLARFVEAVYENNLVKRAGNAMRGLSVLYTSFRFLGDARYLAQEYIESPILLAGREGPQALWEAARLRGKAGQGARLMFTQEGTAQQLMKDWAWWTGNGDAGAYFRWRNASLMSAVMRGQKRGLVRELEKMAKQDQVLAQMIRQNGDTPLTFLQKLDRDWTIMSSQSKKLTPERMTEVLKPYLDSGVIHPDEYAKMVEDGTWVSHPDLENAIAYASDPRLRVLYQRQMVITQQVWKDAAALIFGQADRSNIQRLLNHPLLYWPISYQIKATKWLAGMAFDRFLGYDTGALPATIYSMVWQEHRDKLASDPDFQNFLRENANILFMAQMLVPVTPWDIGVSVSPFTRMFLSMIFDDPENAYQRGFYSVGPAYTWLNLVPRVLRDVSEGDTILAPIAERLRYIAPLTYNVPVAGAPTRDMSQAWMQQQPVTQLQPAPEATSRFGS